MTSSIGASIITLSVQGALYGAYDATLVCCLGWLVYDENWKFLKRNRINWPILAITLFNFLLSTSYLGIAYRITFATVANEQAVVDQFIPVSHSIENGVMLVTDAGLIYYCYQVFHNSAWHISIVPILLYFANIVFSVFQLCWTAIRFVNSDALWVHSRLRYVQLAFYSCSIAITCYTTSAIIYRIVVVVKDNVNATPQHPLSVLCHILAQSGISYALTRILNLITTSIRIEPQLLKSLSNVLNFYMACITFNLIQIRAKQKRRSDGFLIIRSPISPIRFQSTRATDAEQAVGSEKTTPVRVSTL